MNLTGNPYQAGIAQKVLTQYTKKNHELQSIFVHGRTLIYMYT